MNPQAYEAPAQLSRILVVQEETGAAHTEADGRGFLLQVHLSSGVTLGCDVVVSATGVVPDTSWLPECLDRDEEGGLLVDRHAQLSSEYQRNACTAQCWVCMLVLDAADVSAHYNITSVQPCPTRVKGHRGSAGTCRHLWLVFGQRVTSVLDE